jgi:probable O-glycosylation ligase (exosortase A-associated)
MNPHRLTWSFAYDLELAQMVAVATLLGAVFTKDRQSVPFTRETVLLAGLWTATLLSTLFAWYPAAAWPDFQRFSKIVLMTFVTVTLCQQIQRVRQLLLVAALSIGFYGIKGALWALKTGGEYGWVLGPEGSFIGDNNGLALGLNMALPLLFFLARHERRRWLRWSLWATFFLTAVAIPFTYSRAGFLGLCVVALLLVARSSWKWSAVPATAGTLAVVSLLPDRWFDRIASIAAYAEDGSAVSRLTAWRVGWGIALDSPLFGGGFRVFPHPEVWATYAPDWSHATVYNAHSIYFEVLGEHGFLGFFFFVGTLGAVLLSLRRIRRRSRSLPDAGWLAACTYAVEASLVAFLVTGAFYNLAAFDLVYLLIGITIILDRVTRDMRMAVPSTPAIVPAGSQAGSRLSNHIPRWNPIQT